MFRVLQAFCLHLVYAIISVQAYKLKYKTLQIGRKIEDNYYITHHVHVNELGLKGDNFVEQIRINDECYGADTDGKCPMFINAKKLDVGEFINEIEYEWNINITYLSFRTNKGQHIEAGNPKNETIYKNLSISSDLGYGRLDNIKVVSLALKSGKHFQFLDIKYYHPHWQSNVKTTNVSFILSYTPATEIMTEYEDPDQRAADAYTKVYTKYFHDLPIQEEIIKKIGENFKILDGKIVPKNSQSNSTIKHSIPDGYVGVQIAVGELLEGESEDWLFPTSAASYLVVNASDVRKVLGNYEIGDRYNNYGRLLDLMQDLMPYATSKYGITYYAYSPKPDRHLKKDKSATASFSGLNATGLLAFNPILKGNQGYINEVEYQYAYDKRDYIANNTIDINKLDYISICTTKNYCITKGAKSTDGVYVKLENIRGFGWRKSYHDLYTLHLYYKPNYRSSQLIAANVTFILDFTPAFGQMVEYFRSKEKKIEVFAEALRNIQPIEDEDYILYEIYIKFKEINEGLFLTERNATVPLQYDILDSLRRELKQAQMTNLTTQIAVPEGYVGAKIVTGELWKGDSGIYWMFPTTTARTLLTKEGEINAFLNCYDLTRKLHNDIPSLKEYMKIQNGFVYYEKQN